MNSYYKKLTSWNMVDLKNVFLCSLSMEPPLCFHHYQQESTPRLPITIYINDHMWCRSELIFYHCIFRLTLLYWTLAITRTIYGVSEIVRVIRAIRVMKSEVSLQATKKYCSSYRVLSYRVLSYGVMEKNSRSYIIFTTNGIFDALQFKWDVPKNILVK